MAGNLQLGRLDSPGTIPRCRQVQGDTRALHRCSSHRSHRGMLTRTGFRAARRAQATQQVLFFSQFTLLLKKTPGRWSSGTQEEADGTSPASPFSNACSKIQQPLLHFASEHNLVLRYQARFENIYRIRHPGIFRHCSASFLNVPWAQAKGREVVTALSTLPSFAQRRTVYLCL